MPGHLLWESVAIPLHHCGCPPLNSQDPSSIFSLPKSLAASRSPTLPYFSTTSFTGFDRATIRCSTSVILEICEESWYFTTTRYSPAGSR